MPSYAGSIATFYPYTDNQWYSVDVTDLVSDWVNGIYSNYGILLKNVQDYDKYYDFSSREGNSVPYLDIWYDLPDLVANQPSGWSSSFVISRFKGKRNFDTEYYVGVPLYVSWSIKNIDMPPIFGQI